MQSNLIILIKNNEWFAPNRKKKIAKKILEIRLRDSNEATN